MGLFRRLWAYLEARVRGLGAWSHFTDARLFHQLALAVVVGDAGGDARATGLGALGPWGGLHDALLALEHVTLRLHSECWDGKGRRRDTLENAIGISQVGKQVVSWWKSQWLPMVASCLPGRDLSPPLTKGMNSFLLVRSLSDSSVRMCLPNSFSIGLVALPSSHTHSSQHWPATLTSLGLAQPRLGRESSCGHSGMQPTAPSIHVHWCLQLGWKLSPFW